MCTDHKLSGGTLLLSSLLLAGCEGMVRPDAPQRITIASNPAGAVVLVSGRDIGTTPLEVVPGEVFDSGFAGMAYRYKGRLELNKPGCEPYATDVDDALVKADIEVQLKCDPDYVPEPAAVTPAAGNSATPAADPVEQRLERIERLHRRGMLSDEEYQGARQRIIDNL